MKTVESAECARPWPVLSRTTCLIQASLHLETTSIRTVLLSHSDLEAGLWLAWLLLSATVSQSLLKAVGNEIRLS